MGHLTLVLVAVDAAMARAWRALAEGRSELVVHEGSITDVDADAVVSPANSLGIMAGGIDGVYARCFPGISDRVQAASGGELPVGEAVIVPTGVERPAWLVSAPTMSRPGVRLPADGGAARAAAGAVFRLWRGGTLPDGTRVRDAVRTIAMPGLGTGVGGLSPEVCATQVGAAWDEVLGEE
jgi:O-acetyl-ADP-ribose deacetylase (regulator of RNase III)